MREASANKMQEAVLHEQQLQDCNIQLESEASRLRAVCKDLKEGFAKTRDLLRLEQVALDGARTEVSSLTDVIRTTKDELQRMQASAQLSDTLHRSQLEALAASMNELDVERGKEVAKLKEDLVRQCMHQSALQQELLDQREKNADAHIMAVRSNDAARLLEGFSRLRRGRISQMFC
jgi:hypothetical protein